MARIRQQYPNNYTSSGNVSTEFENVIRYLNAAELGNKTLAELMAILFDDEGEFAGPIEFRNDSEAGIQYRVGTYDNEEDGWETIVAIADIRGPAGQNVGTIEGPFFFNRQDTTGNNGQTDISYTFDEDVEDVVVFIDGLLQAKDSYTKDSANNEIVLDSPLAGGEVITVYSIRTQSVTDFNRQDYVAAASQAVFAFVHGPSDQLLVWKNGILQRSGGANDYTNDPAQDTITFTSALNLNDLVTIMTVENQALQTVAGLMLEDEYTDGNGKIDWSVIAVDDGEIAQAKITDLVSTLATTATLTVSATTPVNPSDGDLWVDSSVTPNVLKFYSSSTATWVSTNPSSSLPSFSASNANEYVRVNGTGTAYELGEIDFSSLVPKTYMGAANGVASLDSSAKLPTNQLPEIFSVATMPFWTNGSVTNGTYLVQRIYKQKIRIDGITHKLNAGTCSIQLSVDGVAVGDVHSVSSTATDSAVSPTIEVDATSSSKRIEIVVTSASAADDLEVGIAIATLST